MISIVDPHPNLRIRGRVEQSLLPAGLRESNSPPRQAQSRCRSRIQHVYDSRSIEFADQLRSDTDGYGVDIVLNSVTGAAQRAGLELLASAGASSRSANATSTATAA